MYARILNVVYSLIIGLFPLALDNDAYKPGKPFAHVNCYFDFNEKFSVVFFLIYNQIPFAILLIAYIIVLIKLIKKI